MANETLLENKENECMSRGMLSLEARVFDVNMLLHRVGTANPRLRTGSLE